MNTVQQDLAYAWRSLRRTPAFTTTVVLTLALGIGANSAIVGAVDAVLLRPPPFPDAERVVSIAWEGSGHLQSSSAIKFQYWHDHARAFDAMATWRHSLVRVDTGTEVSAVETLGVSRGFLRVLGYTLESGRDFVAAEHVSGSPTVAIISHTMWRTHFGRAADVVGRSIRLNDQPVTIIGVLPEPFAFPYENEAVDMIVPLALTADPKDIAENWPTIARIREGFSHEQAQTDISSLIEPFRQAYPNQVSERDRGMTLATFSELYVADSVRHALWILMGAVTLVLMIACANVANLFLARAARRRTEIAVRAALGATRARITRLVLAESVLVAIVAGALGLLMGQWLSGVLVALTPVDVPRMANIGVDWRVTVFTFFVSLATSVLFGGAAAWPSARPHVAEVLKERARGSSRRGRMRQGLLVAQSALSMVLLAGAGLLIVTLIGLTRLDPGFEADGVVAVRLPSKPPGYETSQAVWELQRRVIEQFNDSSVVASIAGASSLPLERGVNTPISIAGRRDLSGTVEWRAVTPAYFATLGIPLLSGRAFENTDLAGRPAVAIVNEAFARRYFEGQNPIGERIEVGRFRGDLINPSLAAAAVEIIGVVADIREVSLRTEPRRTIYVPQAQASSSLSNVRGTLPVFIARSSAGNVERTLIDAIRAADPSLPRPQVVALRDVVARSLARERFGATLLSVLAALALILTAFGIYGVLAYTVQQQRREIGIRMALGASGRHVARLVMRQGIAPVAFGAMVGVASSIGLSQVVVAFLWGVTPADPATLAITAALLLGVALAASWLPARDAVRVDPVNALNCE